VERFERPAQDNTGYDLRDLFIGSEGTLASSPPPHEALPLPAAQLTALAAVPSLDAAVTLLVWRTDS